MKKSIPALLSCLVAGVSLVAIDASATTIRVQCEQRGVQRSKISVDGNDLAPHAPGQLYRAQVVSSGNVATSNGAPLDRGEVEFDFDSNPADVAAGATGIGTTFIVDGTVTGKILMPNGTTLIADTVACRVRSR